MSIKVKIEAKGFERLKALAKELKTPVDSSTAAQIGEITVERMKKLIAGGISPIQGQKRFPAYKDKKKYPGKRKASRPVNLYLTGDFQNALTYRVVKVASGYAPEIFYDGQSEDIKEQGHREGANGQPKRPTLPSESKETFAVTIVKEIREILLTRLRQIIG